MASSTKPTILFRWFDGALIGLLCETFQLCQDHRPRRIACERVNLEQRDYFLGGERSSRRVI